MKKANSFLDLQYINNEQYVLLTVKLEETGKALISYYKKLYEDAHQ
jgi:hypothetical protein